MARLAPVRAGSAASSLTSEASDSRTAISGCPKTCASRCAAAKRSRTASESASRASSPTNSRARATKRRGGRRARAASSSRRPCSRRGTEASSQRGTPTFSSSSRRPTPPCFSGASAAAPTSSAARSARPWPPWSRPAPATPSSGPHRPTTPRSPRRSTPSSQPPPSSRRHERRPGQAPRSNVHKMPITALGGAYASELPSFSMRSFCSASTWTRDWCCFEARSSSADFSAMSASSARRAWSRFSHSAVTRFRMPIARSFSSSMRCAFASRTSTMPEIKVPNSWFLPTKALQASPSSSVC
mmetsp:Transcript_34266/g.118062  ORF Transcript_34266/g.118062 Transcript_34266/m.118062 type:complete len:300 (+) Transcript_34266:106-1005(+)